ncbi:hypothetical protein B0A55_10500 [Friedmanniomyces simplex]|uniref:Uncharacterized protein n=1 Tax=Friedmanniomyces simplex TaxID=329884 RepID=A0A4U0WT82_9PEZI|nr:hypothetical protein B0A55_10500 [Friedmanniomyces simplex]
MALEAFNMHRALRSVHNQIQHRNIEEDEASDVYATIEENDGTRLEDPAADDASPEDQTPLRSPPSASPDLDNDRGTTRAISNVPLIPLPRGIKRRHSSPSTHEADYFTCPDLRRAYKRLRTEHASCEAVENNYRMRLQAVDGELANALVERDEAREECLVARRRARLADAETDDLRLRLVVRERHEAVGLVAMVMSGWVGIQVGRELE